MCVKHIETSTFNYLKTIAVCTNVYCMPGERYTIVSLSNATYCTAATNCNTLQHIAPHYNTLQPTAAYYKTTTQCTTQQDTAAHYKTTPQCTTQQDTAAHTHTHTLLRLHHKTRADSGTYHYKGTLDFHFPQVRKKRDDLQSLSVCACAWRHRVRGLGFSV